MVRLGRPGDGHRRHDRAWEARRNFDYVAEALAASGLVPPAVASALRHELADALVVRGLAPVADFAGRTFPHDEATAAEPAPAGGPQVWLEAEVERHLGMLAAFAGGERRRCGQETLHILAGPVRALSAAGAGVACSALIEQLRSSLAAAGFDTDGAIDPLAARPEWVRFLHEALVPTADEGPLTRSRRLDVSLGELRGRQVVLRNLAWSADRVELSLAFGPLAHGRVGEDTTALGVRVIDDRERLHLGHAAAASFAGGAVVPLRPGFDMEPATLALRISAGPECIDSPVVL